VDGVLVQWGDRLFYPGNRIVRSPSAQNLYGGVGRRAAAIRRHIRATVRRAPQVMVKLTGGGRGMRAIAAHFAYITRNGKLEIEDDRPCPRHLSILPLSSPAASEEPACAQESLMA
jgi:hypothetical protein